MKERERYPKEILFYLNQFEKGENFYGLWTTKYLREEDLYLSTYEITGKYKNAKNIDIIKDKVLYIYFDENFKSKAKKLIKTDKQKILLINCINSITSGKKECYMEEQFKCCKGFIYSLFESNIILNEGKLRFNFGIFFEKTPRKNPYETYMEKLIFFDYREWNEPKMKNYDRIIYNFQQKYAQKNNDLEYDKMILLGDKKGRLFYNNKEEENCLCPFQFELPTKNEIYKKINIFGKEYLQGFNMEIWDLKYPIDNILNYLNEINKFNYNGFFEKDILHFHPSKIETKLINMNDNFILSGRPGTGKTVIILIKVIMFYLRCLFDHSNFIRGEVDYDYINNNLISNTYSDDEDEIVEEDDNIIKKIEINKGKNNFNVNNNKLLKENKNKVKNNEEKNEEKIEENNDNHNKINLDGEKLGSEGNTYKIIFTSLSQSLCAYVENYFIEAIKNSQMPLNIVPTSQKTYEKMSSFANQKKYPLFLNFRKLIFMIDGSLNYHFFDRPNNNQLKKRQKDCDIRYYPDCEYDVMANLSILTERPGNIYFYRRKYLFDPLVMTEINEDTFHNYFDTQIICNEVLNNRKNRISSYEVYSNIISLIKGSVKSYICGYLSREEYYSLGKKVCPFTQQQKKEIYDIFEKYEKWKANNNYFDMQDVVNYLIREVNIELVPKHRKLLDLVFIDEVQDFSINQLYLLFLISRDIKVLAGDTCQTISKINTFRFADLNNALYTIGELENIEIKEPKNIEINLNFRCQANILKFSHLIYEIIHYFFINTLDKVRMDFSTQVGAGEKPFLIPYKIRVDGGEKNKKFKDFEDLENKTGFDYFLKGLTDNNLFLSNEKSIINIAFSVNHCVICRNNDIIKQLNKKYNNKIFCSTVYESKGLEYEIVILYNYFKDSPSFIQEIWKFILKNIRFSKVENNHLALVKQNLDYENVSQSIKDQIYTIFKDKVSVFFPQDITQQFSMFNFCYELKELYVAITRAKSRLFIYEENMDLLKLFIERINDLDLLVQEVFIKKNDSKDNDDINNKYNYNLVENFGDNFNLLNKRIIGLVKFINKSKTTKEQLSQVAYAEYNQDNEYNYKKAFYLFQVLNNDLMKNKCLINLKYIEMQRTKGSKNQNIIDQCLKLNKEIFDLINKNNYDDSKQIKGEVLLNLEKYEEALEYFKSKKNYKKCGIALLKQLKYETALEYFSKAKEYSFAVYCLIELKEYEKLYLFLLINKKQFDLEHIQYYYKITCNQFFKKYDIPIKNINKEKLIQNINTNTSNINPNKKKNKNIIDDNEEDIENQNKKVIEIKNNIISYEQNQDKKIDYIDNKNNLLSLIKEEKIPIKRPFIIHSKSNYSIFDIEKADKNLIYDIRKTKEQIVHLIKCFKDFINFASVYLQIIISKTEKTKNQGLFIKECSRLIGLIEDLDENADKEKLSELMENLRIKELNFKGIILGILKNIDAKEYIYNLYDIFIFKANLLEHILADLSILYKHKQNNNKIGINILYKESIEIIVEYSKYLPINENDIIRNIKSAFILCYNFEGLLGIMPNNDIKSLLDLSIILKKQKLFELIIKKLEIDFTKGKFNNNQYKDISLTNYDIAYYMNNYICMLLYKFFKYFLSETKNHDKIKIVLEKIKIFPKLYNILIHIYADNNKNNDNLNDFISLIEDINEYNCENENNYIKLIKLILIGSEISLITFLYGHMIISINFDLIKDNTINVDLLHKYITLISKIENVNKKVREMDIINGIQNFSLLNAFGIYSINNYLPKLNKNYEFIKNSKIIQDISLINYKLKEYKELYLEMDKDNKMGVHINNTDFCSFPASLGKYLYNFIEKILTILHPYNKINDIVTVYKFMFNFYDDEIIENYQGDLKDFYFNNENEFNKIIRYLNEYPYDGEYLFSNYEKEYYIEGSKIIYEKNHHHFTTILEKDIKLKDYKDSSFTTLINYILYSNLIGGMIKTNYKSNELFKDSSIKKYFDKNFSYIHAFNLIDDYYSENLNQLLVIIWLRKIYNCLYTYFYNADKDKNNKFKLYINKKSKDKQLNIYEINKILSENNCNNNFIENYLNILKLFIKENKNNNIIISDIKSNFSQIYYSLISLYEIEDLIDSSLKRKIKSFLDEMNKYPKLFDDNKDMLKEVIIINDKEKKNEIIYKTIDNIDDNCEKDDVNEEYEEYETELFDEIEHSFLNKISNANSNKYY